MTTAVSSAAIAALRTRYTAVAELVASRVADSETNFTGYDWSDFGETAEQVQDQLDQAKAARELLAECPSLVSALQTEMTAALAAAKAAVDAANEAESAIEDLDGDVALIDGDADRELEFLDSTIEELEARLSEVQAAGGSDAKGRHMPAIKQRPSHTETKSWTAADVERVVDELDMAIEAVVNDDTLDADAITAKLDELQGIADHMRSVVDGGSVDGATDEDTRLLGDQLNSVDQLIVLAREKVAAMQSGKSRFIAIKATDNSEYVARAEAAKEEVIRLQLEAEALIASDQTSEQIVSGIIDISDQLSKLMMKIPQSDYDANPIQEGIDAYNAASDLNVWLEEQYAILSGSLSKSTRRIPLKSEATPYDLSTPDAVAAALASADLGAELEPDEMTIVATFIADENPEISDVAELTRIYDAAVRRMLKDMEMAA